MTTAEELQELVGDEAMEVICSRYGGTRIFIPKTPPRYREQIAEMFNVVVGSTPSVQTAYEAVAHAMHVSTRTVQRVVCK